MILPTVKIRCGDSYKIINEAEFNPATDELYIIRDNTAPAWVNEGVENLAKAIDQSILEKCVEALDPEPMHTEKESCVDACMVVITDPLVIGTELKREKDDQSDSLPAMSEFMRNQAELASQGFQLMPPLGIGGIESEPLPIIRKGGWPKGKPRKPRE